LERGLPAKLALELYLTRHEIIASDLPDTARRQLRGQASFQQDCGYFTNAELTQNPWACSKWPKPVAELSGSTIHASQQPKPDENFTIFVIS
jgi:hypothetical protein